MANDSASILDHNFAPEAKMIVSIQSDMKTSL